MKKLSVLLFVLTSVICYGQKTKIMVMDIKSEIDPRTTRYVKKALDHATDINADIVIIEMDTYGGVLTDAKETVDMIMHFKKPIWVFINADAASAGALISIACDSIYMSPGATIGAATVVESTGERAPDKYQSYMRSIMRSTAEENGRNPSIAEAMVDEKMAIDSITKAGQILTFSTSEAIKYGYCEGKVESIQEILTLTKIKNYDLEHFELSNADSIIAFFLNPFISGILILIIIGGIYFEMQTPGAVLPGAAALIALVLYLVPYYLNGLAANWEILALFIGFGLLAVEVFVLPGFGVAGITGITLIVVSLILIMVNNDFFNFDFVPKRTLLYATAVAIGGAAGGISMLFFGGSRIANSKFFRSVALTETQQSSEGYTSNFHKESMKGKKGTAHTVLRPSGRVLIDGEVFDAYTRGEYIEPGQSIEVINDEGTSLRVRTPIA